MPLAHCARQSLPGRQTLPGRACAPRRGWGSSQPLQCRACTAAAAVQPAASSLQFAHSRLENLEQSSRLISSLVSLIRSSFAAACSGLRLIFAGQCHSGTATGRATWPPGGACFRPLLRRWSGGPLPSGSRLPAGSAASLPHSTIRSGGGGGGEQLAASCRRVQHGVFSTRAARLDDFQEVRRVLFELRRWRRPASGTCQAGKRPGSRHVPSRDHVTATFRHAGGCTPDARGPRRALPRRPAASRLARSSGRARHPQSATRTVRPCLGSLPT